MEDASGAVEVPGGSPQPLWYDTAEEEELQELLPTELNTSSHPRYLAANRDKLTIRYVGKGNHTHGLTLTPTLTLTLTLTPNP